MIFRYSYLFPEINFFIKNKPLVTAIKAMTSGFLFVFHLVFTRHSNYGIYFWIINKIGIFCRCVITV